MTVAIAVPWALLGIFLPGRTTPEPPGAAPPPRAPPSSSDVTVGTRGPWGQLEWSRIVIAPPDDYVTPDLCETSQAPWLFADHSINQLKGLFDRAGLTDSQRRELDTATTCGQKACQVAVSMALVASLSPSARASVYSVLGRDPANLGQFYAFRRRSDRPDYWVSASGLPDYAITLINQLFYRQGDFVLFADIPLVCSRLTSPADKSLFVKAISRTPTLLVKLIVEDEADVDAMARYWGRGKRAKDVKPFLETLAREPGTQMIDVVHLMPAFARARLYTFPAPDDPGWDCNWTSMNFFNSVPDDRFLNAEFVKRAIEEEYRTIPFKDRQMGDVILFVKPDGQVIHSSVYVADDIVFTKNGKSSRRPWVLGRLEDLSVTYFGDGETEIRVYRNRYM